MTKQELDKLHHEVKEVVIPLLESLYGEIDLSYEKHEITMTVINPQLLNNRLHEIIKLLKKKI